MVVQLIGWASAALILWIFTEAILHERGTCVAMVIKKAGSAVWRHGGALYQRLVVDLLRKTFQAHDRALSR
jgi:hypothetical protein